MNRWLGLQSALLLVTDYTSFTAHPAWNVFKNLGRVRASGHILLSTASLKHLQMTDMLDNSNFQNNSLDEIFQRKEKRKQSLKTYLISGLLNVQWPLRTSHQTVLTTELKEPVSGDRTPQTAPCLTGDVAKIPSQSHLLLSQTASHFFSGKSTCS